MQFVSFSAANGGPDVSVNAHHVRRVMRNGETSSIIQFAKDDWVDVDGTLEEVVAKLEEAI